MCTDHEHSNHLHPGPNRWKNSRPKPGHAYLPTTVEHIGNIVTHAIPILPSVVGLISMIQRSVSVHQLLASMIYGTALVMLFSVSSFFHYLCLSHSHRAVRYYFHLGDRAVIYIFIAASYTPWLILRNFSDSSQGPFTLIIVWVSAMLGIFYQFTFHERYKQLEIVLYVMVGVCPAIVATQMLDQTGVQELAVGGFCYIFGLLFFKSDGMLPLAHAIWHLFVAAGAYTHYVAISSYLIGQQQHSIWFG